MKAIDSVLALSQAKDELWKLRESIGRKHKMKPKGWRVSKKKKRKAARKARRGKRN